MKQLVFEIETEKRVLGDFEEGKDAPFLQLTKALLDFDEGGFYATDFREGIIKEELKEVEEEYVDEYTTREIIDELKKALEDEFFFFIYEERTIFLEKTTRRLLWKHQATKILNYM